jgi:hypothetical protein
VTRLSPQQAAFASGEISPLLYGRPDYVRYRSGLRRCRGFLPLPEGVATRLPGTRHVGRVKGDGPVALLDFVFRDDDSYTLEFTPGVMRVWRQGAPVMDGAAPYELVTPYDAASLPLLQTVQSADRVYLVDGRRAPQRLSRVDHDDWSIEPTPFKDGPFGAENDDEARTVRASAATGAVTLTGVGGPFAGLQAGVFLRLDAVGQAQVPTWTGNAAISVGQSMAYDGRVYRVVGFDAGGTTTGPNPPTHAEGDVLTSRGGPVWRFVHAGFGVVRLTAVTDANTAAGTVTRELPADVVAGPTHRWSPPAWSDALGWPRAIGEHDQRVIYAGASGAPRTVWASRVGDPLAMDRGVDTDEGFSFNIAADRRRLNPIRWLETGASGLHIATAGGHVTARPSDAGVTIGPTTTDFKRGRGGAAPILPAVIDDEPVFVAASRRRLRGLGYAIQDDRVRADEITQNARHLLTPGVAQIAWQEEPWRVLWMRMDDGGLVGMTLYPDQQVFAMHRDEMAGGVVRSIAVKPTDDGAAEELWLAVERVIGGETRVLMEVMAPVFFEADLDDPDPLDAWHLCAAVRYAGPETATITGLGHLEGAAVVAWSDQGAQAGVVEAGALALERPVTRAIVGLDPSPTQSLRTLPLTPQGPRGGQDGLPRVVREVGARLLHTAGGTMRAIAIDDAGVETPGPDKQLGRRGPDPFARIHMASGVVTVKPTAGWGADVELEIRPAPGAPLTVVGLTPSVSTEDE